MRTVKEMCKAALPGRDLGASSRVYRVRHRVEADVEFLDGDEVEDAPRGRGPGPTLHQL